MDAAFLKLLNMSVTAGYVILAILLVRLLLRKAPKSTPTFFGALRPSGCAVRSPSPPRSACFA